MLREKLGRSGRVADGRSDSSLLPLLALAALTVGLALLLAWPFVVDPSRLAHTRDPAWYTWRTRVLLEEDPALLLTNEGPFGILTGGYRITTPVVGALLHRVAGIDLYRFTVLLEVGVPILVSLALGAFAYRHKRDSLALSLTMAVAVPLFMTVPFIGYMDNGLGLLFLALALFFVDQARQSWRARSALFLLVFLAMLTHVPSTVVFGAVLGLGGGVRLVAYRFSFRRFLRAEGPILVTVGAGILAGLAAWRLGIWGPAASLSEAAVAQPYPGRFFERLLSKWLRESRLEIVIPLFVAGSAWVAWEVLRRRSTDRHSEFSVLAMLPVLGTLGFMLGLTYPYYRFINVTLGPFLLAGLGAWAVTRGAGEIGRRIGDRWRLLEIGAAALLLASIGLFLVKPGVMTWSRQGPWLNEPVRLAVAGASAYASASPESPIIFVIHPKPSLRSWGHAKQNTNFLLGALEGNQITRTFVFVGTVQDFLAGQPTVTGNPTFNRVSRGYLAHLQTNVSRVGRPPVALLLPSLYRASTLPPPGALVQVGFNLWLVKGPGLAVPSDDAARAARVAVAREEESIRGDGPGFTAGHLIRLGGGLVLLLLVPGLLAARWLGLRDFPTQLALVPGVSIALVVAFAVLVVAVRRAPFDAATAWVSVILAVACGAVAGTMSFLATRGGRMDGPGDEESTEEEAPEDRPAPGPVTTAP
jgi:hypothetical protein